MNDAQRASFEKDGYLILSNSLSPELLQELILAVDRLWSEHSSRSSDTYLHQFDFLCRDRVFVDLLELPAILSIILDILGWNIYLYHAHLDVNQPIAQENAPALSWHRDNARMNNDIRDGYYPLLAIKVSYWLSDASESNRGNLCLIPGSHKWNYSEKLRGNNTDFPEGSIPLLVKPGDIVVFDSRVWHSRSNNYSDVTRKVLFYGYSYRWLRARDDVKIPVELLRSATPIQLQLLTRTMDSGAYDPHDDETPLRHTLLLPPSAKNGKP